MTMVAQKFKVLLEKEKRTFRGSALVTLSDTNKASVCREESKGVWRMGYATFVYFCTCLLYLCFLLI